MKHVKPLGKGVVRGRGNQRTDEVPPLVPDGGPGPPSAPGLVGPHLLLELGVVTLRLLAVSRLALPDLLDLGDGHSVEKNRLKVP
jgi:hypothetical protein